MNDAADVFRAIVGLVIGGLIFVVFGTALAGTALEGGALVNFRFWGVIYILGGIVLGVIFVGGIMSSVLNNL